MPCQNSGVIVAAGPREAERRVVAWVLEHRARSLSELDPPIRIVVPSRSLARHLGAALVRELGATAGVVVQTHRSLAREVLERAGEDLPPGASLAQELLVRRFAAAEPALAAALDDVEDGYAPVAASVRDLVDAGFTPELLPEALDALRGSGLGSGRRERAEAVLRVGAKVLEESTRLGSPHRGTLLERATRWLTEEPGLVRARRVVLHGFAEATGLVTALLAALVDSCGAEVILDLPPDPALPERPDSGGRFADRLAVAIHGGPASAPASFPDPPCIELFRAPGPEAEIREVAARVRRLLDDGVAPESVAVVARRLDVSLLTSVRRQFSRLGIPFSGEGAAVPGGGPARAARALARLFLDGADAPVEVWLQALGPDSELAQPELAGLAFRTVGAETVAQAAELDVASLCGGDRLQLPVVLGVVEREGRDGREHLYVSRPELETVVTSAGRTAMLLETHPEPATGVSLRSWLNRTLKALGWGGQPDEAILVALSSLAGDVPDGLAAAWPEVARAAADVLSGVGRDRAGGVGGGVQVLSVTEARGWTFEHLFLVRLNRGVFPFRRSEDPIVPEAARAALAQVAPAIPLLERSPLEERYLFAQLLAAAPRVTLSYLSVDAEGCASNPSAFLERLDLAGRLPAALHGGAEEFPQVPEVFGQEREGCRPALERLTTAGLAARREALDAMLKALRGSAGRHAVVALEEFDPLRRKEGLGPLDGLVGLRPPDEIWVTRLEAFSRCPFRYLVGRELGVEPPPESALAGATLAGRVLGSVVHRALEEIVRRAGVPCGPELVGVLGDDGVAVDWPDDDELEDILQRVAREVSLAEGVPALAPALARRARSFVERARDLDWGEEPPTVLAAETIGAVELDLGQSRLTVRFRADRADREADARLVLTDYKTGSLPSAANPETRIRYVRQGRLLQGGVYGLVLEGGACGRYVALKEGHESRKLTIELDGVAHHALISRAVAIAAHEIISCWKAGVFFPRVESAEGVCGSCDVRSTCLRDDSGFRRRLGEAIEALGEDHPVRRVWEQRRAQIPEEGS